MTGSPSGSRLGVASVFLTSALASAIPMAVGQEKSYQGKTAAQWIEALPEFPESESSRLRGASVFPGRWQAAYALGQLGPQAVEAVPTLARVLENYNEHEYVRGAAAWALGRMGPEAHLQIPLLRRTLGSEGHVSEHVSVRRNSVVALGNFCEAAEAAVPELIARLEDDDAVVRINAAEALWKIARHDRAIPALVAALNREQGPEPYLAAIALGQVGADAEPAVPDLIEALAHLDEDAARAAAHSLGQIGPAAIPALERELKRAEEPVRRRAVEALARIGAEAVPLLIKTLRDDSPLVRCHAARALGRLGPIAKAAEPALLQAINDPDQTVRATAARALTQIGSDAESSPAPAEPDSQ